MRKVITVCLMLICIVSISAFSNFKSSNRNFLAEAQPNYSEISMEKETGTVIESKNADVRLPMASTTKIMTAIIAIEGLELDREITVPKAAVGVEGSSIYLKEDEVISVRDLLYGLMLRSGNDAAAALAITHSGSVEAFVKAMNDKAKVLGFKDTNFTNPSGLPDENHFTTARELASLTRYALNNETFAEIVSTKNYAGKYRTFQSKNKFLRMVEGADGVKTGYTKAAGRCLVSSATRDDMTVIAVVLNCPQMYERSSELIEKVFSNYELVNFDENQSIMCGRVLCKTQNIGKILLPTNSNLSFTVVQTNKSTTIKKGDFVGELKIYDKNSLLLSQKLFSIVDV